MRVISRKRLREFWERYPDAKKPLDAWYRITLKADWGTLQQVREAFPHADGIELYCGLLVTVFNVGGNKYRLVTRIIYRYRRVYVKLVLTHRDYDKPAWKAHLCREYDDGGS
jgi:mRNA interferase HigB